MYFKSILVNKNKNYSISIQWFQFVTVLNVWFLTRETQISWTAIYVLIQSWECFEDPCIVAMSYHKTKIWVIYILQITISLIVGSSFFFLLLHQGSTNISVQKQYYATSALMEGMMSTFPHPIMRHRIIESIYCAFMASPHIL